LFPELEEKAKKLLGYETFTELSIKQAVSERSEHLTYVPIETTDPLFKYLVDKQREI
jgi:hypothetical protein